LQDVAKEVIASGRGFAAGDTICFDGPIATRESTGLGAAVFVLDPELGSIDTPHGRLQFLQLVRIHTGERRDILEMRDAAHFLQAARDHLPLFVTDLDRPLLFPAAGISPHDVWPLARRWQDSDRRYR
jgi:hypothetical protein